jgi:hypothetical protein
LPEAAGASLGLDDLADVRFRVVDALPADPFGSGSNLLTKAKFKKSRTSQPESFH